EPDRERLGETGEGDIVRHRLAERLADGDLDQVDPDGVLHEIGHLTAGDPSRDFHHLDATVLGGDQLWEGDAVLQPEGAYGLAGDPAGCAQLLAVDGRWVDMDPADAEADAGGPEPVGERDELGLAVTGDDDPIQLGSVHELLQHRFGRGRLRECFVEITLEIASGLDTEDPTLPTGVDRLEDGGRRDCVESASRISVRAEGGERRLW